MKEDRNGIGYMKQRNWPTHLQDGDIAIKE